MAPDWGMAPDIHPGLGRIAEILFKNGRDETESALIDAPSAKTHPNSLIEARLQRFI